MKSLYESGRGSFAKSLNPSNPQFKLSECPRGVKLQGYFLGSYRQLFSLKPVLYIFEVGPFLWFGFQLKPVLVKGKAMLNMNPNNLP